MIDLEHFGVIQIPGTRVQGHGGMWLRTVGLSLHVRCARLQHPQMLSKRCDGTGPMPGNEMHRSTLFDLHKRARFRRSRPEDGAFAVLSKRCDEESLALHAMRIGSEAGLL